MGVSNGRLVLEVLLETFFDSVHVLHLDCCHEFSPSNRGINISDVGSVDFASILALGSGVAYYILAVVVASGPELSMEYVSPSCWQLLQIMGGLSGQSLAM